jgi:signal transduction histidine kinase/CheY-like chemotaxis protein
MAPNQEHPISLDDLECEMSKRLRTSESIGSCSSKQKHLLEFVEASEERKYIEDLWSRESWRFVLTGLIASSTAFVVLAVCYFQNPASTRLGPLFMAVVGVTCVSVMCVLLWKGERGSKRCRCLFYQGRKPLQWAMALSGSVAIPLIAIYNAFYACDQEVNVALYQCLTMKHDETEGVPFETVIFVLAAPLVLKFLNVPFRWVLCFATLGLLQLVVITLKLTNGLASWKLVLIFTWATGFMLLAAWYVESADRKWYLLRLEVEKRHGKQLELTQLEAKAAAEETLLSFLCHEIRNPYCSLLGYVEFIHAASAENAQNALAADRTSNTSKVPAHGRHDQTLRQIHGWCSSVLASSRHMLDLLDNVLDLSKLENKKMRLAEQPLNLHQLCEEVRTMLAPSIKTGVSLLLDIDRLEWISADPLRWRQLLVNLLSNAFKFTNQGSVCVTVKLLRATDPVSLGSLGYPKRGGANGSVAGEGNMGVAVSDKGSVAGTARSRTSSTRTTSAMASSAPGGQTLSVRISDTGCGVSPECATKLFSIFESKSNAFAEKGSGVGLVLSQHIVQLMGGDIRVDSPYERIPGGEPVSGTCMYFTIPVVACEPPAGDPGPGAVAIDGVDGVRPGLSSRLQRALPASLAVLIVEDEPMNQLILRAKLEQLQCNVACTLVDTAEQAVDLVSRSKFELIVMDQHLEKADGAMTGAQATKQLRDQNCAIPVIMCSGNCGANDRAAYLAAGATMVWPKPYPTTEEMSMDISELVASGSVADAGSR